MKKTFNIFMLFAMIALLLASCKKDEQNRPTYVTTDATTTLTSSATAVELSKNTSNDKVITFNWVKPNYSFNASVTYTLQFDVPSDSFKTPISKSGGTDVYTQSFNGGDLNQIATQLKMTPDTGTIMKVRIKATVAQNGGGSVGGTTVVPDVYSDAIDIRITPYSDIVVYPAVYVAGQFQGWDPTNGVPLYSFNSDGKYEGYAYITGTSASDFEFKFTGDKSWSGTNYGSAAAPTTSGFITSGTLSTDGGAGNLSVPAAGYYRLKVDATGLTWEGYQTTSWGMIGDATPGGWDNETAMTYNATDKVWVIESVALTAGSFKFRANNAWDLSYGYDATNTKLTADNGANISLTVPGNYKVVLDLSNSTNYNFVLTKL